MISGDKIPDSRPVTVEISRSMKCDFSLHDEAITQAREQLFWFL